MRRRVGATEEVGALGGVSPAIRPAGHDIEASAVRFMAEALRLLAVEAASFDTALIVPIALACGIAL